MHTASEDNEERLFWRRNHELEKFYAREHIELENIFHIREADGKYVHTNTLFFEHYEVPYGIHIVLECYLVLWKLHEQRWYSDVEQPPVTPGCVPPVLH